MGEKLFCDIITTKYTSSEGIPIFKFVMWNDKGQMIDTGKILDFSKKQVKNRILKLYSHHRIIFGR